MNLASRVRLGDAVAGAREAGRGVVALETAVVTHGLPPAEAGRALQAMVEEIASRDVVPAICLIDQGCLWIGAEVDQALRAASDARRLKVSVRELALALALGVPGGLTVSATLFAAQLAGIRVFATGGIGGVHTHDPSDVSADLPQLARSPVITVCSGAKSVLDIPRTLEHLETLGVPVYAYGSEDFPAFYLAHSGLAVPRVSSPALVAELAQIQWELGLQAGLVIGNPIPAADSIGPREWNEWLERAEQVAAAAQVRGQDVTPYLLARVAEYSEGKTVRANVALLRNNARLAAEIASALTP